MNQEEKTEIKAYLYTFLSGFIIAVFLTLFFKGCEKPRTITREIDKPVSIKLPTPKAEAITKEKPVTPWRESKKENSFLQKQIDSLLVDNEKLKNTFVEAPESTQIDLYNDCIKLNKFSSKTENKDVNIEVNGIVRGEVKSLDIKYNLIPQPQKEVTFRLLSGGGVGIDKNLRSPYFKIDLGFQNQKGDIISGSAMKINSEIYFTINFHKSIFVIKK